MNDLIQGGRKYASVWQSKYSAEKLSLITTSFSWGLYAFHLNVRRVVFSPDRRGTLFLKVMCVDCCVTLRQCELFLQDPVGNLTQAYHKRLKLC